MSGIETNSSPVSRRRFQLHLAAALTAAFADHSAATQTSSGTSAASAHHQHDMSAFPPQWTGKEQIVMVMYPSYTALDLFGPQYMLASLMGAKVHLVAKNKQPVRSDTGVVVVPDMSFQECLRRLPKVDVMMVPGGSQGTLAALRDPATMSFLTRCGARSETIASVCTGSILLAGAGLLQGYKATSHWATRDLLSLGGAIPVNERVVVDRNRMTGGGVTAGIDLGLRIVEQRRDVFYAQCVQLLAEYAPAPHLNSGTPETAPPMATAMMQSMFTQLLADMSGTLTQLQKAKS
jgi:cyclohexyl-isocyanide hydratase